MEDDSERRIVTDEMKFDLLEFIMQSYRILLAEDISTWFDFFNTSHNLEKYSDWSPKELCEAFLIEVLPNIYSFDLNANEREKLNLLKIHNVYVATENGFQLADINKRYFISPLLEDNNLMSYVDKSEAIVSQPPEPLEPMDDKPDLPQLVLMPECTKLKAVRQACSLGTQALLPAVFGTDLELSNCSLLPNDEIRKRFYKAKSAFENKGILPKDRLKAETLLQKIKTMKIIQEGLVQIAQDVAFIESNENEDP